MSFTLMTADESRAMMWARIDSRRWWVIPWIGDRARALSQRLEETFYDGRASSDFEIGMANFGGGIVPVTFAHKRHLSARKLAPVMIEMGHRSSTEEQLRQALTKQDILIARRLGLTVEEDAINDGLDSAVLVRLHDSQGAHLRHRY